MGSVRCELIVSSSQTSTLLIISVGETVVAQSSSPFKSLNDFGPVDETLHIGTTFPSESTQISALLSAPNSDELIRDLARLVSQRGVVFFKNQSLTLEEQKKLGLRLGQLTGRPAESSLHRHPVTETTPELGTDTQVISSMQ